ncbi:hypothetical protein NA56DRAFT_251960 [Hyaloscypha hepaticicola]|uniref:Uncharacterized protein n=1 Tax=Hyaloscypha hepaticicola TaxID=2082293 RepID=A0A2J6PWE3_9HELO|nr:hypothetical protein NA56DRAFT_251960 [Hyaloscypha hepaticicola]
MSRKSEENLVVLSIPRPEPGGFKEISQVLLRVRSSLPLKRLCQAFLRFGSSRLLRFIDPRFGKSNLAGDLIAPVSCSQPCLLCFHLSHFPRLPSGTEQVSSGRYIDYSVTKRCFFRHRCHSSPCSRFAAPPLKESNLFSMTSLMLALVVSRKKTRGHYHSRSL